MNYQYAYFIGSLITVVIWIAFFLKRKDLRKEMLVLSFATITLAPTNILYYGEYWKPLFVYDIHNFGIESILVCFTYGGICGVCYEYLFRKTGHRLKHINLQISKIQLLLSVLFGMVFFFVLEVLTELNAIYTSSFSLIFTTIFFILFRKDLFFPSLMCGLIATAISMVVYWILLVPYPSFFDMFWIEDTITGLRVLFIPLEEYLFHFALGSCVGVMYEIGYAEVDKDIKK